MFKENAKNEILNLLTIFQELSSLESHEGVTAKDIEEAVKKARTIPGLMSDESYKEFTEVFLPSISSPFGKELAIDKCRMTLRNINVNLLSLMKKNVETLSVQSKELKNKNLILDNMYDMMGKYRDEVQSIRGSVTSYDGKDKFLKACQTACSVNYRGLLYFGHSPISLGKVLAKVMGSAFDKEGPVKGENYINQNKLKESLGLVGYYLDRETLSKTSLDRLEVLVTEETNKAEASLNALSEFPKLPGYKLDDMVEFLMKAYESKKEDYNGAHDDAQGNAIVWLELANMMTLSLEVALEFFNRLKPRLGSIGSNNFSTLLGALEKLEESYKLNDMEEIKKFTELVRYSIIGENAVLLLETYDVLSFVTSTEYLCFTFTLIYIMFKTYQNEYAKEITGE